MKGEKGGPGLGGIPGENFTITGIVEEVYYTSSVPRYFCSTFFFKLFDIYKYPRVQMALIQQYEKFPTFLL